MKLCFPIIYLSKRNINCNRAFGLISLSVKMASSSVTTRLLLSRSFLIPSVHASYLKKSKFSSDIKDKENTRTDDDGLVDIENPFHREKLKCILCKYGIEPDYKNVKLLSQFVSPYTGRVYGKHITRLCAAKQQAVESEIMKAQSAGLMAHYLKEVDFLKDPELFDPAKPIRPHRF